MASNKFTWMMSVLVVSTITSRALALEPQPIQAGGVEFIPTVTVGEAYDDNVWRAPADEVESMVTTLAPSLLIRARDGLNLYQFKYDLLHEEVHSSQDDTHTDHDAKVLAHLEFTARHRLDIDLNYVEKTTKRSTTNRLFNQTGNESNKFDAGLVYGFGAKSAKGQIDLTLNMGQVRYDNNLNSGATTRLRERDTKGAIAAFYYRLGGRTRALAEVVYVDYDYKSSTSPLDGDSETYRLGLEWKATAKTTGHVRVGREYRQYDKGSVSSVSRPSWAAAIVWQPRTYSTFSLKSESYIGEGGATETSIDIKSFDLIWDHEWTSKHSSHIEYGFENYDYNGLFNDDRDDDIKIIKLGWNYEMLRWFDVGLFYQSGETDSNDFNSEYERNVFGVKFEISL